MVSLHYILKLDSKQNIGRPGYPLKVTMEVDAKGDVGDFRLESLTDELVLECADYMAPAVANNGSASFPQDRDMSEERRAGLHYKGKVADTDLQIVVNKYGQPAVVACSPMSGYAVDLASRQEVVNLARAARAWKTQLAYEPTPEEDAEDEAVAMEFIAACEAMRGSVLRPHPGNPVYEGMGDSFNSS